jgi:hypothetical protein
MAASNALRHDLYFPFGVLLKANLKKGAIWEVKLVAAPILAGSTMWVVISSGEDIKNRVQ